MINWKKYKLGDLVTFQRGHDLPKTEFIDGPYPIAGSNGIIGYHNQYTTLGPGITIGRSGSLGVPYFYEKNFWAHNTTLYVKEFHNSDPKFIYYLLQTLDFSGHNSGSAVPSLNRNFIHPIEVLAPSNINIQKQIASILSSLDDKIELNRRMNQTLEQIAATLFKKYFVDDNDPDNLPKGWYNSTLGDEVEITSSKRIFLNEYVSNGVPFYRGKEIIELNKTGIISNELFITEDKFNEIKNKFGVPKEGDILITSVGTIGVPYLVNGKDRFYFKDGNLTWIRKYFNYLSPYYLYQWLITEEGQYRIENIKIGSTQQAITIQSLKTIKLSIPPKDLHDEISRQLETIRKRIVCNICETKTLISLRDALLPKLMSGEIDLSAIHQNEQLHAEVLS